MTQTTFHIPTLETERLILRAPKRADFEAYERFMAAPRSHASDPTPRKSWQYFSEEVVGWCLDGFGHWIIETRPGAVIGVTGFSQPAFYPEPEIGWALYDGYEGQGFATEAASAARDWARARLSSLVSYIAPKNAKSIAVAERLGAKRDDDATLPEGTDASKCLVYRHWGQA